MYVVEFCILVVVVSVEYFRKVARLHQPVDAGNEATNVAAIEKVALGGIGNDLSDGILAVLAELHRRGYRLGIVSNKLQPAVTELHRHFFADTVAVAIGESAGVRRKPAPDTLLVAMERLGATAADTVYVGDSDVDILTARAAGVPCLSVLWGFRPREELLRAGATDLVTAPEELSDMFP